MSFLTLRGRDIFASFLCQSAVPLHAQLVRPPCPMQPMQLRDAVSALVQCVPKHRKSAPSGVTSEPPGRFRGHCYFCYEGASRCGCRLTCDLAHTCARTRRCSRRERAQCGQERSCVWKSGGCATEV